MGARREGGQSREIAPFSKFYAGPQVPPAALGVFNGPHFKPYAVLWVAPVLVIQSGVMSGFDQWLSGGLNAVTGAYAALPVWAAGALAALLCFLGVMAFARSAQIGRAGAAWRVALVLVGAGLTWVLVESLGRRDQTVGRSVLDARSAELTLRAIAPGSPLACLETVANATIEAACEKSLFASPETIAAAVAYVDARLTLLADGLELAARDRSYEASIERSRRAMEADRFGVVAHVLATRGCTTENCPALKLLRDPGRVAANLRERSFDANVVLHAAAWRSDAPAAPASAPSAPALAAAPPATVTTGIAPPPAGRFDYPSAASIPAISIMNAEPPLPSGEANAGAPPQAQTAAPPAPAARAPAPRRQSAQQAPQPAPSVPMPLAPPGTLSNPR